MKERDEGEQNHFSASPSGETRPEGVREQNGKEHSVVTYLEMQPVLFGFCIPFQLTGTLI